jgi:hypothetical protein
MTPNGSGHSGPDRPGGYDSAMSNLHKYVCSNDACGYDGYRAKFTGTIEFSVACFCPVCGHALYRDDVLGALERAELGSTRFMR